LGARNVHGDTPLHCLVTAIAQGPIGTELRRLIEVFLDHSEIDFSVQNNHEQTALDIANKYKIQWLVDLIAKKQEVTNIERLTKKGITTWTCDELCVWLKLHGLSDYVAKFRDNHITGQILVNICTSENSDVLRDELGVQSLGHRTELKNKVLYMYNTQMAQEHEGADATNGGNATEEPFDEQALNQLLIDISEFDFGEVIGKGYFGEVRKGQWKGVTVALKYIYRQRQEQRKLLQEVYLLSRLRHPNVIQLLGWSQGVVNANDQQTSLVMALEFMEYGSLYHVIKHSYKSLTLNMKWRIMTDIIRGMTYLHGRGVIHRDLNTKNLLVDSNWTTKISDFGLSKLFNADREMTTHVGFLVNMAPEVFKGQHYTQQADVFSFAMVLYELYTGQEPHNVAQLDPLKFAHRVAHEDYRPPLTGVTCDSCPQHVLELVVKCWDTEPSKRPSFAAMLTALMSSNVNKNPPPSPVCRTTNGKVHVDSSRMESPDVDSNNYYMEK
jgi:tRNA A-37 threonylcarbamoyl transferase component Bud32